MLFCQGSRNTSIGNALLFEMDWTDIQICGGLKTSGQHRLLYWLRIMEKEELVWIKDSFQCVKPSFERNVFFNLKGKFMGKWNKKEYLLLDRASLNSRKKWLKMWLRDIQEDVCQIKFNYVVRKKYYPENGLLLVKLGRHQKIVIQKLLQEIVLFYFLF